MVQTQLRARDIRDERVCQAMAAIPRHWFVRGGDVEAAYADRALPTADGQTISQPYMVALMTQLLGVQPGDRVLEIGTGSGYQTAILAWLGARVVTIERHEGLSAFARDILRRLKLDRRVDFVVGDGTLGWPAEAPYDGILVTAACPPSVPSAYFDQLAEGGHIVIPVGTREDQDLYDIFREQGQWQHRRSVSCRFVPLIGAQGWPVESSPSARCDSPR